MTARAHREDDHVPTIALEIDVQTALALSRATTRAISAMSPEGHKEMVWALEQEAMVQKVQGGPVAELVASLLAGYAVDLP